MSCVHLCRAHTCVKLGQYAAAVMPGDTRFAELMKEIDDKAPRLMIPELAMAMEIEKPKYRHNYGCNNAKEVVVTGHGTGACVRGVRQANVERLHRGLWRGGVPAAAAPVWH
jgi:suppressor of G2 allele of SKP1